MAVHSESSKKLREANSHSNSAYNDPFPDRPIQLLRPDPTHHRKLEVVERNVQYLHRIDTAVAVVAVVGKFHSGKSFLLNQLMGKTDGFGVGPSVRPQTMGIWMWGKVGNNGVTSKSKPMQHHHSANSSYHVLYSKCPNSNFHNYFP